MFIDVYFISNNHCLFETINIDFILIKKKMSCRKQVSF